METVSGVLSSLLMRTRFSDRTGVSADLGCNWLKTYRGCALEPADGDSVRGTVLPAHEDQVLLTEQASQLILAVTG
jgi:hypothetical protein